MVLIDSSSWIESLRHSGKPDVRKRVNDLMVAGQAAWCDMILLELWNGTSGAEEKKTLKYLESIITKLEIEDGVWKVALNAARKARDAGMTVPAADLVIFACSKHHGVALEHCDAHLAKLQSILP